MFNTLYVKSQSIIKMSDSVLKQILFFMLLKMMFVIK